MEWKTLKGQQHGRLRWVCGGEEDSEEEGSDGV